MKHTLSLLFSIVVLGTLVSCKTTENPETNLASTNNEPVVGEAVFGCYKVKQFEATSSKPEVLSLKSKATKLCLTPKPITLSITDKEDKGLLSWTFTKLEPLRCPDCFNLTGGQDYRANITRTIVPTVFNMSLDSARLGGKVRLTLEQNLNAEASASTEAPYQFKELTCGDHWKEVTGVMPTKSGGAALRLSGDSLPKTVTLPAKSGIKGGELVFEAADRSGVMLRVITQSEKFYGVFRDSKNNDEVDLGECYPDIQEEHPLN
jgi:hypothetical protein